MVLTRAPCIGTLVDLMLMPKLYQALRERARHPALMGEMTGSVRAGPTPPRRAAGALPGMSRP